MRPAAPVKMTSGIYSPTSLGMVDRDSRGALISARLTASPSTRKYLEPFQILASAGADSRAAAGRGGRFSNTGAGAKSKGFEGGCAPPRFEDKGRHAAIQDHDRAYLSRLERQRAAAARGARGRARGNRDDRQPVLGPRRGPRRAPSGRAG